MPARKGPGKWGLSQKLPGRSEFCLDANFSLLMFQEEHFHGRQIAGP